jgi:hypothetical protein
MKLKKSFSGLCVVSFIFIQTTLSFAQFLYNLKTISTEGDEFPIGFDGKTLVFIRNAKQTFNAYTSLFTQNKFTQPNELTLPKYFKKNKGSFLSFHFDSTKNVTKFLFSGVEPKNYNSKVFSFEKTQKGYSKKLNLCSFNSSSFDSHPCFSPDGKFVFFTTDRKGTRGGTDIMFAQSVLGNGVETWLEPEFLDSTINSEANEITPFIDQEGNLYFARWNIDNYDIYKARKVGENSWDTPKRLSPPINSEANEIAPVIFENQIFVASNRPNGQGGYDIYAFDLCSSVTLELNFTESNNIFTSRDKIIIQDNSGNIVEEKYLGSEGKYIFNLLPKKKYRVTIQNDCNQRTYFSKEVETLCIDSAYVKYTISLAISNDLTEEIQIPFFVTGYYKPITRENLAQLRRLFDYNFIGLDDSTRFIEKPDSIYDLFVPNVENALKKIVATISSYLPLFQSNCIPPNKRLLVEIIGYSDPRGISENAKFFEETIDDPLFNTYVRRGTKLDNFLLSKLRAYYTAKYLQRSLSGYQTGEYDARHILWEIQGGGIANEDSETDFLVRRKVKISLRIIDLN